MSIDPFEFPEDEVSDVCPSCGTLSTIDGPTLGCEDPKGCGAFVIDFDDEEGANEEDFKELDFD